MNMRLFEGYVAVLRTTQTTVSRDSRGNATVGIHCLEGTCEVQRRGETWHVTTRDLRWPRESAAIPHSTLPHPPVLAAEEEENLAGVARQWARAADAVALFRWFALTKERSVIVNGQAPRFDATNWVFLDVSLVDESRGVQCGRRAYLGSKLIPDTDVVEKTWAETAEGLDNMRVAVQPDPETVTALLDPQPAAYLVHELFGHSLEADNLALLRSWVPVLEWRFPVEVWDDPTAPGCAGSYTFDDEGTDPKPVRLVSPDGTLSPITSWQTSERNSLTGHARAVDYRRHPRPRAARTYLRGLAEGCDGCDRNPSFRVKRVTGGRWLPGRVTLFGSEGERLGEGGRIIAKCRDFALTVTLEGCAGGLVGAGCEVAWFHDLCGKDGDYPLPVSMGAPALMLTGVRIGPRREA